MSTPDVTDLDLTGVMGPPQAYADRAVHGGIQYDNVADELELDYEPDELVGNVEAL